MAHARQQIRDQVVTTVTSLATTGTSVYSSRVYPVDVLPSLVVTTPSELRQDDTDVGTRHFRELDVIVTARCRATSSYDDTLDTICSEVEVAIAADPTLGGLAEDCWLVSTETEFVDDAEQPTGIATLTWRALYRVDETDPDTIIA